MSYENPKLSHEINVSKDSYVRTFFRLSIGLVLLLLAGFAVIYFSLRVGAQYIPYSVEKPLGDVVVSALADTNNSEERIKAQRKLQQLAQNLKQHMDSPEDMPVNIHLSDMDEVNAFATFGGHIVVTQGLLDTVHSENALAMVLAHELAHIKNRDPLISLGSGVIFSLAIASITGSNVDAYWLTNSTGGLTQLTFSRKQESAADAEAIKALTSYYGHTLGAEELFQAILSKSQYAPHVSEFLQSHPDTENRIISIKASQKNLPSPAELTPLPDEIMKIQRKSLSRRR